MTAIRMSFVFGMEDVGKYGEGLGTSCKWIAPPPGSYISTQHNRAAARIQSTGTKFWDTMAYGKLTGSFTWNFVLDYKYLEPFFLVFEKYVSPDAADETGAAGSRYTHTQTYHTFAKQDVERVPSFVIRRKIINHITGEPRNSDEMTELRGCVIRNMRVSKASNTSQINVTLTGFYANEVMVTGYLPTTDYQTYNGQLGEYMCMFATDETVQNSPYEYVANTDTLEFSVTNSADAIYNTCSPFAKNYYEGTAAFDFSTSCWSNNVKRYKTRLYGGGQQIAGSLNNVDGSYTYEPMTKLLKPITGIKLYTYDGTLDDMDGSSVITQIESSNHVAVVNISECVIKSLTWPKADGSKIQDVISSAECRNIWLEFKNDGTGPFNPRDPDVRNALTNNVDIMNYQLMMSVNNSDYGNIQLNAGTEAAEATVGFYIKAGTTYTMDATTKALTFVIPVVGGSSVSKTVTPVPASESYIIDGDKPWTYTTVTTVDSTNGTGATVTGPSEVVISSGTTYQVKEDVILKAYFKTA